MSNTKLTPSSSYLLSSGHSIPVAGFGLYLTKPSEAKTSTYNALKAGYRHIDSAAYYHNEEEAVDGIVEFLQDFPEVKREDIFYTTKLAPIHKGYDGAKKGIEGSYNIAKKIGYIDLYLIHTPLASKDGRIGEWKALQEAVEEGKIKSIGVSNFGNSHVQEILDWEGLKIKPAVNQLELHPFNPKKDIQEFSKKNGILLEAYTPLTQGVKFEDPDVQKVAKKHGYSPAQVLLRWGYDQGFIVLAKTVSEKRAKDNYEVLRNVTLDAEDFEIFDKPHAAEILSGWEFDPIDYVDEADK